MPNLAVFLEVTHDEDGTRYAINVARIERIGIDDDGTWIGLVDVDDVIYVRESFQGLMAALTGVVTGAEGKLIRIS